ncbi:hypothetical protein KIPB_009667, partial [Kipferlia bialata]|eukprot:g9667.t1
MVDRLNRNVTDLVQAEHSGQGPHALSLQRQLDALKAEKQRDTEEHIATQDAFAKLTEKYEAVKAASAAHMEKVQASVVHVTRLEGVVEESQSRYVEMKRLAARKLAAHREEIKALKANEERSTARATKAEERLATEMAAIAAERATATQQRQEAEATKTALSAAERTIRDQEARILTLSQDLKEAQEVREQHQQRAIQLGVEAATLQTTIRSLQHDVSSLRGSAETAEALKQELNVMKVQVFDTQQRESALVAEVAKKD